MRAKVDLAESFNEIAATEEANLEEAKKAAKDNNWKGFCESMKPIISKAEELGLVVEGTAVKIYDDAKEFAAPYYAKAADFAAKTAKSMSDDFQTVRTRCTQAAKSFWDSMKTLVNDVIIAVRPLLSEVIDVFDNLKESGKGFVDKIKDTTRDLFSSNKQK
jgi:hypothetical protein